jgi:hypothetical protein
MQASFRWFVAAPTTLERSGGPAEESRLAPGCYARAMRDPFRDPPPPDEAPLQAIAEPAKETPPEPPPPLENTAVLPRNFTLTSGDRIRALVAGPPYYMRRRRSIEDLEARILVELAELESLPATEGELAATRVKKRIVALEQLVVDHNRYYPIEANLPMDPKTSEVIERGGAPWRPLPRPTFESLRARVRTKCDK